MCIGLRDENAIRSLPDNDFPVDCAETTGRISGCQPFFREKSGKVLHPRDTLIDQFRAGTLT